MSYEGYCDIASIKPRVLIEDTDETYDDALETAGTEASRMIDEKLRPYKSIAGTEETKEPFVFATIPLTAEIIPDIIAEICADLAAGCFKRRHRPQEFNAGWFNQGLTKLQDFINGNWHKGAFGFTESESEEEEAGEESWEEQLFNIIAAIKGTGWTNETLVKIVADIAVADAIIDAIKAKTDTIVWENITTIDSLIDAIKAETDKIRHVFFDARYAMTPTVDSVASSSETSLTAGSITVTFPIGSSRNRAYVVATLHVANKSDATHKIGLTLQKQKDAEGYADIVDLTANPPISLVEVDGSMATFVIICDVTSLIDNSGSTYYFKWLVDSSNAGAVNYTSNFVLVIEFCMHVE